MVKKTKDGYVNVDDEKYLYDENGDIIREYNPPEDLNLHEKNIVQTTFWFYDLQGRLKTDDHPPSDYRGHKRTYVKEDVEESEWDNTLTSYLRVYIGKALKAQTQMTHPRRTATLLGYETADRFPVAKTVRFLLNSDGVHFGWEQYKVDSRYRKTKKSQIKPKRSVKPVKKLKKVIRKKIIKNKRK